MFELEILNKADKFLRKHPELEKQIILAFKEICKNPYQNYKGKYDIVRMQGIKNYFRIRFGDYRVIYTIEKGKFIITIVKADNRGSVYKKWGEMKNYAK